nr:ATP synthase subunit-like protein [Ipomoea batatas]
MLLKFGRHQEKKSNGNWSIPNGEKIMNKLQEEGEKNTEKISVAPLPLVEHFDVVLKRKSSYALGLGLMAITSKAQEKILLQAEIEASKNTRKNPVTGDGRSRFAEDGDRRQSVTGFVRLNLKITGVDDSDAAPGKPSPLGNGSDVLGGDLELFVGDSGLFVEDFGLSSEGS